MKPSTRLFVNTISQYGRTVLNVILSLYSTRLVLEALGSDNYGIYTLVAGVVSMMYFITASLSSTTQRFLSYNQRASDNRIYILRSYIVNSLTIHVCLGLVLTVGLLVLKYYLFDGFLNIAPDRLYAAKLVYLAMVVMLLIALLAAPCRAILLSHENIVYLSVIDALDGVLKLLIAIILTNVDGDRLIWYGLLMIGVSAFNFLSFYVYIVAKYEECKHLKLSYLSIAKIKELTSFACWTTYGTLCIFGRAQGIAVVLNKFLGTAINAAYGISLQINSSLSTVSGALQTAIRPQVIAAEGEGNRVKMLHLSETGCKMGFLLLSIFTIPILFDMEGLLTLWLGNVPSYTVHFSSVIVLATLCDQATVGYSASIQAVGNIRNYTVVENTLKLSTTLVIALLLLTGVEVRIAFMSFLVIEVMGSVLCLLFCKWNTGLSLRAYFSNVLLRISVPFAIYCVMWYCGRYFAFSLIGFITKFIVFSCIYGFFIYKLSLIGAEKQFMNRMYHIVVNKVSIRLKKQ